MDVQEIPLDKLIPSRNLRTERTQDFNVSELVESIREHGLLQPIRVRPVSGGMYQIIAGHRRSFAHRALGRPTIPAVVVEESDEDAAVQGIVENLQREDLTPLELAQGVRQLATSFSLGIEEIARNISKSPGQVRTWIRLSRLPDDVLTKLESGEGNTQRITTLTPRHLQPFVSDMPSEDEVARDPNARARYDKTVETVREFQNTLEERGARVNAHMSDEIARRTRTGQMTMTEAVEAVLANPEQYRYGRTYDSAQELQEDTYAAYRKYQQDLSVIANKLRPEIAVGFSTDQKQNLAESLADLYETVESYRIALEVTTIVSTVAPDQLPSGRGAGN